MYNGEQSDIPSTVDNKLEEQAGEQEKEEQTLTDEIITGNSVIGGGTVDIVDEDEPIESNVDYDGVGSQFGDDVKDDSISYFDPAEYSDVKHITDATSSPFVHPTTTGERHKELVDKVKEVNEDDIKALDDVDQLALYYPSDRNDDVKLEQNIHDNKPLDSFNNPSFKGEEIAPKPINASVKGKEVKGQLAIAIFNGSIGLAGLFQMPLWHSGFHITLQNISDNDIFDLHMKIVEDMGAVGRQTAGLVFSNYSFKAHSIMMDFIMENIQSTSLDVDNFELIKYIKTPDLNNVYLLLLKYLYPNGYSTSISCENAIKIDENAKPNCSFRADVTVDPLKLLKVDKSRLTTSHVRHMSKRKPNSVTVDEVLNYQETLEAIAIKDVSIGNGNVVGLRTPTLDKYFEQGEEWVNSLEDGIEDVINDTDNRDTIMAKRARLSLLAMYGHYVEYIKTSNDNIIRDRDTILEILSTSTQDKDLTITFINAVIKYIDESYVSIVGIPSYQCPECKKANTGGGNHTLTQTIIGLDVYKLAFTLRTMKVNQLNQKMSTPIF